MITDNGAKKLVQEFKKIFPTKEDLKSELKNELKKYATKEDLKNELKTFATKKDIQEITEEVVSRFAENIGNLIGKVKSHDHRIKKLEGQNLN